MKNCKCYKTHFGRQFSDSALEDLPAFVGRPARVASPITVDEVKLNTGRTSGHNNLPAELSKSTAGLLAETIAGIFNDVLKCQEPPN